MKDGTIPLLVPFTSWLARTAFGFSKVIDNLLNPPDGEPAFLHDSAFLIRVQERREEVYTADEAFLVFKR